MQKPRKHCVCYVNARAGFFFFLRLDDASDVHALLKAAHSRRWVGAFSRQVVAKARTSAERQLRREAEAAAKARAARESKNARRIAEGNKKGAGGGEEAERAVSAGEKAKNDDEKKR